MRQKIFEAIRKGGVEVWKHIHFEVKNLSCADIFYITSNVNIYKMGLILKLTLSSIVEKSKKCGKFLRK